MRGTWRMRVFVGASEGGESMGQQRLFVSEPYCKSQDSVGGISIILRAVPTASRYFQTACPPR